MQLDTGSYDHFSGRAMITIVVTMTLKNAAELSQSHEQMLRFFKTSLSLNLIFKCQRPLYLLIHTISPGGPLGPIEPAGPC